MFADVDDHWWPKPTRRGSDVATDRDLRLPLRHRRPSGAVAGARRCSRPSGWDVVVPAHPGLRRPGRASSRPTTTSAGSPCVWDALDATGALAVPGASARPSAACSPPTSPRSGPRRSPPLALLAPFGIFDEANPGLDLYAVPDARAHGAPLRQGRARAVRRSLRRARPRRRARRPLPERRRRREPALAARRPRPGRAASTASRVRGSSLWGDQDELLPVRRLAARWAAGGVPVEMVAGAGHLLEWDAPDAVGARLVEFLRTALV